MPATQVLIVEDENIIAEDLKHSLQNLGYDVSGVASSGREAIEKADEVQPDVVLMDIMLKGDMDGVEAANHISRAYEIPVVYLTAHADDQTFHRAKITEPYGYIIKPYEERELQIAIEMALYKYQAESRLRKMEQWLTTTLKSIGEAVITTDVSGTITFMNAVAEKLSGYKQETALGRLLRDVFVIEHEQHSTKIDDLLKNALAHGSISVMDHTMLSRADGTQVPVEQTIAPIKDEKNNITGLVLVFRDVSERKRAEVQLRGQLREAEIKYRTLVEQVPVVTYIAASGSILYVSPQFETMLGFSQTEWLNDSQLWSKQLHPDDADEVLETRAAAYDEGRSFRGEYRMLAKDGRVVWVRDEAVLLKSENGRPWYLQGVMLDITEQKSAELKLKGSHEQLRALAARLQDVREEERTRMAREVHDELGQVLTALKMELALLNQKLMDSSTTTPRRALLDEIGSITRVVDQAIQTVRKIATELRPEVLDHLGLKPAIESHAQEFENRTGIRCEMKSNIENIDVEMDCASAIFRIFQETLTNVARHAQASQVKINLEKRDSNLFLEVHDNGVGIDLSALSDVKSLGLLGMKERTLLLGGEIQIDGKPGEGTNVRLKVPLARCG
jgi:PAS domain S-box-containing protein